MLVFVNQLWNAFLKAIVTMCEQLMIGRGVVFAPGLVICKGHPGAGAIRKSLDFAGMHFDECDKTRGCLTINGVSLSSSDASLRAVCRVCKLYPDNLEDAGIVDDWIDTHRAFITAIEIAVSGHMYGPSETWYDDESYRTWLQREHIPRYLAILEHEVTSSRWLGGMDNMSMADLRWYETLRWLDNGCFDGITHETIDTFPALRAYLFSILTALSTDGDGDGDRVWRGRRVTGNFAAEE
jgi:hypothetical protein